MASRLTDKERRFVAAYDGNGTKACKAAGYAGDGATLATQAWRLLRKAEVREALAARGSGELSRLTLSVVELQEMLTRITVDETQPVEARLSAARDLLKSQGAFVHRHEVAIGKSLEDFLREIAEAKK